MRILFVSSWFPDPPDNGSRIRIYNLLRALARRHEITLISFADSTAANPACPTELNCHIAAIMPKATFRPNRAQALVGYFSPTPRSILDTFSTEMARQVREAVGREKFDVAISSQIDTACYLAGVATVPTIFEEVETSVIKEGFTTTTNKARRFRRWLTWAKTRRYLRGLVGNFDACTVVSNQELQSLQELAPDYARIEIVPNGTDVESLLPFSLEPEPGQLVFNGALTYDANFDAMLYFLSDIWPIVRAGEPNACLKITGNYSGISLASLPLGNGASLTGYLADIRPTVARAWACVVPLRVGGGTRLKILEAMALGTPVISTTKGAEGLAVTPEENILMADEPDQFAAQTIRLLRDPELRRRIAVKGRRLVEEKYDWRVIGENFSKFVESIAVLGRVETASVG